MSLSVSPLAVNHTLCVKRVTNSLLRKGFQSKGPCSELFSRVSGVLFVQSCHFLLLRLLLYAWSLSLTLTLGHLVCGGGFFSNFDWDGGHAEVSSRRIFIKDRFEHLLCVGQVNQHANFSSALPYVPLCQVSDALQVFRPRLGLSEHLFGEVEAGACDARRKPFVHFDFDQA